MNSFLITQPHIAGPVTHHQSLSLIQTAKRRAVMMFGLLCVIQSHEHGRAPWNPGCPHRTYFRNHQAPV